MPIKQLSIQLGIRFTNIQTNNNNLGDIGSSNYAYRGGVKQIFPYASFKNADGSNATFPKDYREPYTDTAGAGKLLNWKYSIASFWEDQKRRH